LFLVLQNSIERQVSWLAVMLLKGSVELIRPFVYSINGKDVAHHRKMSLFEILLPTTMGEAFSIGAIVGFGIAVAGFWWRTRN